MSTPGLGTWNPNAAASNSQLPAAAADAVSVSLPMEKLSLDEMNRKAHAAVAGLRAEASRLSGAGEHALVSFLSADMSNRIPVRLPVVHFSGRTPVSL